VLGIGAIEMMPKCIVWQGGNQYLRWPEHDYHPGKHDGQPTEYCIRCGARLDRALNTITVAECLRQVSRISYCSRLIRSETASPGYEVAVHVCRQPSRADRASRPAGPPRVDLADLHLVT
jgi:hypothetical protein